MSELFISQHSIQRVRERFHVKSDEKAKRLISLAYDLGNGFQEYNGSCKRFLRDKAYDGAALIYYNNAIYVFYGNICTTAYDAPGEFMGKKTGYHCGRSIRNPRKFARLYGI